MSSPQATPADTDPKSFTRRERRKFEVRQRIQAATQELLLEKGYAQLVVEEICELADVARNTFYNHYSAKEEVIREIGNALLFDQMREHIDQIIASSDSAAGRMQLIFDRYAQSLSRHGNLERILISWSLMDFSINESIGGQRLKGVHEQYRRLFEEGLPEDALGPDNDAETLSEIVVASLNGATLNWVHDESFPVVEHIERMCKCLKRLVPSG